MANEYAVNQADLTAVADAIRSKGGTSDALSFPNGFVSAVSAIQTGTGGGTTVQRTAGKMTLTGDYTTINRGFQPDAIYITLGDTFEEDGVFSQYCAGVFFGELQHSLFDTMMHAADYSYFYEFFGERTANGFSIAYFRGSFSGSESYTARTFDYVAVKYT